jgi:hypothetical protein
MPAIGTACAGLEPSRMASTRRGAVAALPYEAAIVGSRDLESRRLGSHKCIQRRLLRWSVLDRAFSQDEHLGLAGFLAGYRGGIREAYCS